MKSDSSSSDDNLMPLALPIGKIPSNFDPKLPPTTAEEYLQQVMWEAKHCKETVTVDIDCKRLKKQGSLVKQAMKVPAPAGYSPSLELQQEILQEFVSLRNTISHYRNSREIPKPPLKLPNSKNRERWCHFCFGNAFQLALLKKSKEGTKKPKLVEGQKPLLSIVLNISQVTLENLVEWHAQWLEVLGFSKEQGQWFYSLLASLQKPLTPEVCSHLRHIVRLCALLRAALESPDHPHLPQLNVLICIITRYFNQEDLADT